MHPVCVMHRHLFIFFLSVPVGHGKKIVVILEACYIVTFDY